MEIFAKCIRTRMVLLYILYVYYYTFNIVRPFINLFHTTAPFLANRSNHIECCRCCCRCCWYFFLLVHATRNSTITVVSWWNRCVESYGASVNNLLFLSPFDTSIRANTKQALAIRKKVGFLQKRMDSIWFCGLVLFFTLFLQRQIRRKKICNGRKLEMESRQKKRNKTIWCSINAIDICWWAKEELQQQQQKQQAWLIREFEAKPMTRIEPKTFSFRFAF